MIVSTRCHFAMLLGSLACFSIGTVDASTRIRGATANAADAEETQYRRRGKKSGGINSSFTPGGPVPPGIQTEGGDPFGGRTTFGCFDYYGWSDRIGNNCFDFFSKPCSSAVLSDGMAPPSEACCACGGGNRTGNSNPVGVVVAEGDGGDGDGNGADGGNVDSGAAGGCPGDDGSCLGNGMMCSMGSVGSADCVTCCAACCSGKHYMIAPGQGTDMNAVCVVDMDEIKDAMTNSAEVP